MDGFADVLRRDAVTGREIGDGARDFENAVVGTGAEVEILHGMAEHFERGVVEGAEFFDLAVRHAGIGGGFSLTGEAVFLDAARLKNAIENLCRGLGRAAAGELLEGHGRRFDMDVDAVEEWAGDAVAVTLDLDAGAAALALRITVESARTGIHRGDEDEFGGECHGSSCAGNGHLAVLKWIVLLPTCISVER